MYTIDSRPRNKSSRSHKIFLQCFTTEIFFMDKITTFDLLVTYTEKIAESAILSTADIVTPFTKTSLNENYNLVYAYFLKTCRKYNLNAAFTTSADIIAAGTCSCYWLFENNSWIKVQNKGFSKLIFDKFSPTTKKIGDSRRLLFSSEEIKSFNDPYLFEIFFDKQKTYDTFSEYSIPTVTLSNYTFRAICEALKLLKKIDDRYISKNDFSNEIVMKNKFGAGGRNVYKFNNKDIKGIISTINGNTNISYILQPFVKFDKGFKKNNISAPTDIRLIYLGKKIIQVYIRTAKSGGFKCNEHAGGIVTYINVNEVPEKVLTLANIISKTLNKRSSLYALDFIISNSGNVYLIEANTGPGLDWNLSIKKNEIESKKLIRIIVKEIARRIYDADTVKVKPMDPLSPSLNSKFINI